MSEPSQRVHANSFKLHGNGFDVALDFGYRLGIEGEEVEPVALVTTSWEHLRLIVPILQQAIDEYERTVGPIPKVEETINRQEAEMKS